MQDRLIIVVVIAVPLLVLSIRMIGNALSKPGAQRVNILLTWLVIAAPVCGLFLWLITQKAYWLILGLPSALIVVLGWAYGSLTEARDRVKLGTSVFLRFLEALIDPHIRLSTKLGLVFIGLETIVIIPAIGVVYILLGDFGEYAAIAVAITFVLLVGIQLRALGRSPRD